MSKRTMLTARRMAALASVIALCGCVNLGTKAPPSMLVLSPAKMISSGAVHRGQAQDALVVLVPDVPRKLDTNRVPVQVDASNIAYIKDAVWSDKPAPLMQRLLTETIGAQTGKLVLNEVSAGGKAQHYLAGELVEFGVDARRNEAIVVFDAVQLQSGKEIEKRRFEARITIVEITAATTGAALNEAANMVAADIANWIAPPAAG